VRVGYFAWILPSCSSGDRAHQTRVRLFVQQWTLKVLVSLCVSLITVGLIIATHREEHYAIYVTEANFYSKATAVYDSKWIDGKCVAS
jgi:hypothetical protein